MGMNPGGISKPMMGAPTPPVAGPGINAPGPAQKGPPSREDVPPPPPGMFNGQGNPGYPQPTNQTHPGSYRVRR